MLVKQFASNVGLDHRDSGRTFASLRTLPGRLIHQPARVFRAVRICW